ncbi:carbohydrate kinase family protein [Flavobacterium adhaerens]|uniref:carbohydrate kinase family protein n=1 Tax=Flavobacterium adhaerens TaxID=3149043 RepID=UPI0032B5189B
MTKEKKLKAVSYGEVLWDVFENEKKIGGAPLNVALRMKSLGGDVAMISCVGNDADGEAIIEHIQNVGLDTSTISKTHEFPTGLVQVTLNESGSASYVINYPSAWDKIVLTEIARQKVQEADVLIFGSLVCRDAVSRTTLEQLLESNVYKVFDVNLRKPNYTYAIIEKLMLTADFIKLNDEEIIEITSAMHSPFASIEENMVFISQLANNKAVCVTKGKDGASLLWKGKMYYSKGYPITVVDTVGAGDSFLATLITSLLTDVDPQEAIHLACAMGALVAGSAGANPEISSETIYDFMQKNTH